MALLLLVKEGRHLIDLVIFADTKGEQPETYSYLDGVVKPLCQSLGLEFVSVSNGDLYEDCFKKKIIPTRMFRWCSDKYKMRPINKYLKKRFGSDYNLLIGIDAGEKRRARSGAFYPLIDNNIDREGCIKLIKDSGFPVPIKSGCYFCPFSKVSELKRIFKEHKELFLKAEYLEKNGRHYPNMTLKDFPLEKLRKSIEEQKSLSGFLKPEILQACFFCHE